MKNNQTSIKIGEEHYQQIKAIAEKTDMGIRAVAERLIAEGLNTTEQAGKVVASNPKALAAIEKDLAKVKEGNEDLRARVKSLEAEEGEEPEPESGKGRKFEIKKPSVKLEDVDGFRYYCADCEKDLTKGQNPCPGCGETIDWDRLQIVDEDEGKDTGGVPGGISPWLTGGFIVLMALATLKAQAAGNNTRRLM